MSNEHLHTKACQANAMITAIENLRDQEGITDHDFRLELQANGPLTGADTYLDWEQWGSDTICLPSCGATTYNKLWTEVMRTQQEWWHKEENVNEFFDKVRRTLRPASADDPDGPPAYSSQRFFRWIYDHLAAEEQAHEEWVAVQPHERGLS
jgi:hypothetical protein